MFIKLILYNFNYKGFKTEWKIRKYTKMWIQWTLQMGYPVITILGNTTAENRIIITSSIYL